MKLLLKHRNKTQNPTFIEFMGEKKDVLKGFTKRVNSDFNCKITL